MLEDLNIYMVSFANFLTITDNASVHQKKKALLKLAGGKDMIYLFKHIGQVADDAEYEVAVTTICAWRQNHINHVPGQKFQALF